MPRAIIFGLTFMMVCTIGCGGKLEPRVVYSACSRVGGLDRIVITRQDPSTGARYQVILVSPAGTNVLPIMTPANWAVESVNADCTCQPSASAVTATGGSGSITWQAGQTSISSSVTVHSTLSFPSGPSWLSQSIKLDADIISLASTCSL